MPAAAFDDATPLLADPDALHQRFLADGCLWFRGLVDRRAVLGVRREVLAIVDDLGWLEPGTPVDDAVAGPVAHHEGSPGFWPAYLALQRLESFHRLAHDDALLAAMRVVLGGDVLAHPQKIARMSFPDATFFTAPHQDYRYIQGTADFVTAWLPLGEYEPEHGGLRVLAGSFDDGLRRVHRAEGAGGLGVEADDDDPRWRTASYAPGDVVVFGSLTVHGAMPNRTDVLRLSVDYRYQRADEPIAPPSLGPHFAFHDAMPDGWDDISGGWSSQAWIDAPVDVARTRFRNPAADDLEVPPSRWWS